MDKIFKFNKFEMGQILPIVALAMIALIAMAALIIDGAMIMSYRRTAQAAADAAALAGAEWLCPTVYSESDAIAVAEAYVGLNHAEVVNVSISAEFDNTIHVETQVESATFFSGILNQAGLSAAAEADASCSPLSSGSATLPVVYPCEDPNPNDEIVECTKKYYDFDHDDAWNMEQRNFTIIHDSVDQLASCSIPGVTCYDVVSSGAKGWVALEAGATKQFIEDWVSGDRIPPEISAGFWLSSLSGITNSDFIMLKAYEGKTFLVPIYNAHCESTKPSDYCNSDYGGPFIDGQDNDDLCEDYGVGKDSYRIAGFGLFHLTCVHEKQKDDCPYRAELVENWGFSEFDGNVSIKTIEGYFIEGTYPTGGGDGAHAGVYTVHLRR